MNNKNITKYALDNAAKIYPAAMTKTWNAVFGVSAVMNDKINPVALSEAVEQMSLPFKTMYVCLKKGFFWDCLVPATDFDVVEKESTSPCRPLDLFNDKKPLFRIVYNSTKIRVEFSHCVTDGTGAFEYLKALILRYSEINEGKTIEANNIKRMYEHQTESQSRDEFLSIYQKGIRASRKDSNAYQIDYVQKENYLRENEIVIPVQSLKQVSKSLYNCTVTQYVATVYALALLQEYKNDPKKSNKKQVKLSVPVNLRNYFEADTLRNFASYVTINVTPKNEYTFENVLKLIKDSMEEKITYDNMLKNVCQNVADELMPIARYSPNFIKKLVMKNAFKMYGERKYTSTVTSVGYIKMPKELENRVKYLSATLGKTLTNRINCTVIGSKSNIVVTISSSSAITRIDDFFTDFLTSQGIEILKSNSKSKTDTKKDIA